MEGQVGDAIVQLQEAVRLNPADPQPRANLDRALRAAGVRRVSP
jgi:Flp pilus assembly protein TadD